MLEDVSRGMDGTNIRAGIIGETPADRLVTGISENANARILRAAARTSFVSGAALSLHTDAFGRKKPAELHRALDLIREEQPTLARVIIGHVTAMDEDWRWLCAEARSLLERGVTLEFDLIGKCEYPLDPSIRSVAELIRNGFGHQLLLSHDVFTKLNLQKFGGAGLLGVQQLAIPRLLQLGVSQHEIDQILITTPRRLLTFVAAAVT